MTDVGGITVFGGTYPARMWHAYTETALHGQPAVAFTLPDPRKIPPVKIIDSPGLERDTGANSARAPRPGSTTTTSQPKSRPTTVPTLPGTLPTGPTTGGPPTTGARPPPTAGPPTT
jgi:penicillin-binding protein 1A